MPLVVVAAQAVPISQLAAPSEKLLDDEPAPVKVEPMQDQPTRRRDGNDAPAKHAWAPFAAVRPEPHVIQEEEPQRGQKQQAQHKEADGECGVDGGVAVFAESGASAAVVVAVFAVNDAAFLIQKTSLPLPTSALYLPRPHFSQGLCITN